MLNSCFKDLQCDSKFFLSEVIDIINDAECDNVDINDLDCDNLLPKFFIDFINDMECN